MVSKGIDSLGLDLGPVALQGDPAPGLLALKSKIGFVDLNALSHAGVVRAVGGLTLLSSLSLIASTQSIVYRASNGDGQRIDNDDCPAEQRNRPGRIK